jgi:hypothetical protein
MVLLVEAKHRHLKVMHAANWAFRRGLRFGQTSPDESKHHDERPYAVKSICRFADLPICRFADLPICRFAIFTPLSRTNVTPHMTRRKVDDEILKKTHAPQDPANARCTA